MNWQTADPAEGAALDRAAEGEVRPGEPLHGIGEVQRATGLSARTLRYYEELGLLPGVRRRAGGRRVYGPDEVERLRFIQRLKALGLSLAEIKELNAVYAIAGSTRAMLTRLSQLLDRHQSEIDGRIQELSRLRDEIAGYRRHVGQRVAALERGTGGEA